MSDAATSKTVTRDPRKENFRLFENANTSKTSSSKPVSSKVEIMHGGNVDVNVVDVNINRQLTTTTTKRKPMSGTIQKKKKKKKRRRNNKTATKKIIPHDLWESTLTQWRAVDELKSQELSVAADMGSIHLLNVSVGLRWYEF